MLSTELTLVESGTYRFWLAPILGRPVRELRSHRMTAEADTPPRVEILGPADRLELPTPRPIEIGYAADDDYGLGRGRAGLPRRRPAGATAAAARRAGARAAQGRLVWDPAAAGTLLAGERIAYRVEAKDRDEVSGAKIGSSRTLYVVIQNPHESIEERLDRQRELLDRLVADLANRLEQSPRRRRPRRRATAPRPRPTRRRAWRRSGSCTKPRSRTWRCSGGCWTTIGARGRWARRCARRWPASPIGWSTCCATRRRRWGRTAARRRRPARRRRWPRSAPLADKHTAELEKDVLLLDDLIGRQRLEDLARLGRELTDAHQRLQDLLGRYKATKDRALRRQLEREARDLRARIADLAQKIAALKARNDVPEEWRNMPDMKAVAEQARKLDDLLEKGDEAGLSRALSELGENLKSLRQMLDQNLEGFGAERFPQENRVVAELMKKIGDLEGDERALQKETQALADRQEAEVERRLKGQLDEFLKRENEKIERLRSRLAGVQTGDPESALAEEIERARDSAKQMKRLFAERDLAEAKGEAERAASSLDRAARAHGRRRRRGRRKRQPQAKEPRAARRHRGGQRGARDRAGDRRRSGEDPAARRAR